MRLLSPRSSERSGGVLGAVITLAALGIALSAVVLVLSSAFGHSDSPGHSAQNAADTHAAAQGGGDTSGGDMSGMSGMHGEAPGGVQLYAVQTGPLGVVVTDGEGRVLYGSHQDANNPPTSRCTAACAQEWLPVVVPPGQQPELLGVDADRVGRVTRADGGSQLTLGGWPVYVNKNDDGQLAAAAPDAHGAWFLMTPQGEKKEV